MDSRQKTALKKLPKKAQGILKKMPPLKHKVGDKYSIATSEIFDWFRMQHDLMEMIFEPARRSGVLRYDPERKIWIGAEHDSES